MKYAGEALRGVPGLLSKNSAFAKVVVNRGNTAGFISSSIWGSKPG